MLNKKVTIFSCLAILAIVEAKPTTPKPAASSSEPTTTDKPDDEPATIISSEFEYDPINGNFSYSFESSDGSKAEQVGELKQFENDTAGEVVKGKYEYIDADGNKVSVSYTADENGFVPVGNIIPTPPPLPKHVVLILKYLEEHPYVEDSENEKRKGKKAEEAKLDKKQ